MLAQPRPTLPMKTNVAHAAKGDPNETKVQQSVWIAYRENTKQKKGGQVVPTVLLAQHLPPLPTKNNVAHVAKAAINEQKVQQSVWIAFQEHTNQKNNKQSVSCVMSVQLPPMSRERSIATRAPKAAINTKKVQRIV